MDSAGEQGWPRKEEAREYLKEHKILELFDNLTAQLIYARPENPREFMMEQIGNLQRSKATHLDYPCLFDESNIQSIFGMLDPTGRGFITLQQYYEAMDTLGVIGYAERPAGSESNKITLDTFSREAKLGLARASATFSGAK